MKIIKNIWIIILTFLNIGIAAAANWCYSISCKINKDENRLKMIWGIIVSNAAVILYKASDILTKYHTSLDRGSR